MCPIPPLIIPELNDDVDGVMDNEYHQQIASEAPTRIVPLVVAPLGSCSHRVITCVSHLRVLHLEVPCCYMANMQLALETIDLTHHPGTNRALPPHFLDRTGPLAGCQAQTCKGRAMRRPR